MSATLNVQLQGHTPAFRDAEVQLVNQATGASVTRKPFLDGSLIVRDLDPGVYQMRVTHPNLTLPIDNRPIRIFDQLPATLIPVRVPPTLFLDTPIRDIPDADLGPVQTLSTSVRDRATALGGKASGEVIRAADWNGLVGAVTDLANAVLQLASLAAPRGHDHPEIAEKIDEVQGNLRRFAESFGRSLLELRREIEAGTLHQRLTDVLAKGQASTALKDRLNGRVQDLQASLQADTVLFSQQLSSTGSDVLTGIHELATQQSDGGTAFLSDPQVKEVLAMAGTYLDAGVQTRSESELQTYRQSTATGGPKLGAVFAIPSGTIGRG